MSRGLSALIALLALGSLEADVNSTSALPAATATNAAPGVLKPEVSHMWMTIGDRRFAITLSDNAAARAWHLSALLRARDEVMDKMRAEVVQDLRRAATIAAETIV